MQITVCVRGTVIIDDDIHTFDINATAEDISSDQNTFFEGFECGVSADSIEGQKFNGISARKKLRTAPPAEGLNEWRCSGNCRRQEACPIR